MTKHPKKSKEKRFISARSFRGLRPGSLAPPVVRQNRTAHLVVASKQRQGQEGQRTDIPFQVTPSDHLLQLAHLLRCPPPPNGPFNYEPTNGWMGPLMRLEPSCPITPLSPPLNTGAQETKLLDLGDTSYQTVTEACHAKRSWPNQAWKWHLGFCFSPLLHCCD